MGGGSAASGTRGRRSHGLSASGRGGRASSPAARPARPALRFLPSIEIAFDVATLALVVVYFFALVNMSGTAKLWTDECFHASMAEWIAERGALPSRIPELYGGFYGFYPPLFHLLGAAWVILFGPDAFRHVNVFVTSVLLIWIALDRRAGDRTARRWAILLCLGCTWIAYHGVRLYVEQLTAMLAVGVVLLALRVWRGPTRANTVALGVTLGLGLLTKQTSLILIGIIAGLAAIAWVRRERATAVALAQATGISLLVASPWLIRNAVLYGTPIYPAFARDIHPLLMELNRKVFTPAPHLFYRDTIARAGWAVGLTVLAAGGLSAWRRRGSIELLLLGVCLVLFLAGPLQPLLDVRHMLPVMAVAAVLGAILVVRLLEPWPAVRATLGAALLVASATTVISMPNYRAGLNAPPVILEALEETGRRVPLGETVLSLWTYDTWYYARRPATWPIPWSQPDPPIEMFLTSNCDSVMFALRRHQVRFALVPRITNGGAFDGTNYPASFIECVQSLLRGNRLKLLWYSSTLGLIEVPAADSLPAAR